MQFGIRAVCGLVGIFAAWCACVFTLPLMVSMWTLMFLMIISPAVWIAGVAYGRGAVQAFFLCGLVVGLVPHICAVYYGLMVLGASPFGMAVTNLGGDDLERAEELALRTTLAIWWLVPGLISVSSGILGAVTHRVLTGQPPRAGLPKASADLPHAGPPKTGTLPEAENLRQE
jgi:hypothetical protein